MGAGPSSEILTTAPFRPARLGSGRVLTLIPMTEEFFPSASCPLFEQFYEARTDPYVRYYIRGCEQSDHRLDYIPPATFTPDELYERHVTRPGLGIYRAGNEELRADYLNGHQNRIRPIPCAVAFQYDDQDSAPEGCVALRESFVRVIGGVGCFPNENSDDESLDIEVFLRKSAGDHNMARVMLFAAWLFHEHCTKDCELPSVPMPVLTFHGLKTNIPFFCFLRELRDSVELLQGNKEEHKLWLDGAFVRCHISAPHAAELCVALANRYRVLLVPKIRNKLNSPLPLPILSGSSSMQQLSSEVSTDGEDHSLMTAISSGARFQKQFYTLCGCIESPQETIPARASSPNDVYLVCVDSVLQIAPDTADSSTDSMESGAPVSKTQKQLEVRRGDVLRFVPDKRQLLDPSTRAYLFTPPPEPLYPTGLTNSVKEDAGQGTLSPGSVTPNGPTEAATSLKGIWLVDPTIHLENVLLALVHDECKSAREAPPDDPHWMRDPDTNELVFDGNFYIWKFSRDDQVYFYGTVPKFANTYKKRHDVPKRRGGGLPLPGDGSFNTTGPSFREGGLTDMRRPMDPSMNPQGAMPLMAIPTLHNPQPLFMGAPPTGYMPMQNYRDGGQMFFVPSSSQMQAAGTLMGPNNGRFDGIPQTAHPFVHMQTAPLAHMHHMAHGTPVHIVPQMQPMQTMQTMPAMQTMQTMPGMQTMQTMPGMPTMPTMQTMQAVPTMQAMQAMPAVQTMQTMPGGPQNNPVYLYMGHQGMQQPTVQTMQPGPMMPMPPMPPMPTAPPPLHPPFPTQSSAHAAANSVAGTGPSHFTPGGVGGCGISAEEPQLPIVIPTPGAQGGDGMLAFGQKDSQFFFMADENTSCTSQTK